MGEDKLPFSSLAQGLGINGGASLETIQISKVYQVVAQGA